MFAIYTDDEECSKADVFLVGYDYDKFGDEDLDDLDSIDIEKYEKRILLD